MDAIGVGGWLDAGAAAQKQTHAEFFLESLHRSAKRLARDISALRGFRE